MSSLFNIMLLNMKIATPGSVNLREIPKTAKAEINVENVN